MTQLATYQENGLQFVVLENTHLKTVWLPAIGGKLVSLIEKTSGVQVLGNPGHVYTKDNLPFYGAPYGEYSSSGFDECFPTIHPSNYKLPGSDNSKRQIQFPDHGEVWSLPWDMFTQSNILIMKINGVRRSYELRKDIQITHKTLHLNYTLTNYSDIPLHYLWAANPIFQLEPEDAITVKPSTEKVLVDWIEDTSVSQPGEVIDWSAIFENHDSKIQKILPCEIFSPLRLYTDRLSSGNISVSFHRSNVTLTFQFDPDMTPYLGIEVHFQNHRDNDRPKHTVSLLPSTGRPGSLAKAIQRDEIGYIRGHGLKEWSLKVILS